MKISAVVLLLSIQGCAGYLKLATYYQDHMVLQRGPQQAVIWGTSNKIGDTVSVEVSSGHGTVTTTVLSDPSGELDGVWKVKLPAITDPGPFTITASSSVGKVTIQDVLFGDVWMCSGQSNMYFPISWLFDPPKTISEAIKFDDIRIFKAHPIPSTKTLQLLRAPDIPWSKPTQVSLPDFSALCWLYAQYLRPHLKYPLGMVESSWGGTSIEAWSPPATLAKCPKRKRALPGRHEDNVLWNSMINPFTSMTLHGIIWYQGEANTHFPDRYACEFPAMIADWRDEFSKGSMGETSNNFPFGFAQLAPNGNSALVGGVPFIRWAQTANTGQVPNLKMPNTFMAVAMDLPDFQSPHGTIHPRYKEDVAKRLVLGARALVYQENNVAYQGPFPTALTLNTHSNLLTIEYGQHPIEVRNNAGFEVCCSWTNTTACATHDHWGAAPITSNTTTSVTVSTADCGSRRHLVGLRYEWHTSPCPLRKCAVYGRDTDLPAPPYIRTTAFAGEGSHIIG